MQSEGVEKVVPGSVPRSADPAPARPGMEFLSDLFASSTWGGSSGSSTFDLSGNMRSPVTFDDPAEAQSGSDAIICESLGETTGFGPVRVKTFRVDRKTGALEETGRATAILTETVLGATIPKGTRFVGHPSLMYGFTAE